MKKLNYNEAIKKIKSLLKFGSKPGLERIKRILDAIGNPQDSLKFVHIAGTNGKGSTCTILSSVLTACGYKTGLFTSPYIINFRERIQINNQMIPKNKLIKLTNFFLPFIENSANSKDPLTEFEIITAMAFKFFKDENCDIVVLETGLGGRFDATNVIKNPILSIITPISLDHTDILGDTIEKIAAEKCGIIKPNCPVVLAPNQKNCVYEIASRTANKLKSQIFIADKSKIKDTKSSLENGTTFDWSGLKINMPLMGEHQLSNSATALTAIKILKNNFKITPKNIISGFKNIKLPARFQVISKSPLIILDGAHNPDGARALADSIKKYLHGKNVIGIVGMLKDKDVKSSLAAVLPLLSQVITISPNSDRAMTAHELTEVAYIYNENTMPALNLKDALKLAESLIDCNSAIVIFGSFYLLNFPK